MGSGPSTSLSTPFRAPEAWTAWPDSFSFPALLQHSVHHRFHPSHLLVGYWYTAAKPYNYGCRDSDDTIIKSVKQWAQKTLIFQLLVRGFWDRRWQAADGKGQLGKMSAQYQCLKDHYSHLPVVIIWCELMPNICQFIFTCVFVMEFHLSVIILSK